MLDTLPALEQRLAECLLDFDRLDEAWPKERRLRDGSQHNFM